MSPVSKADQQSRAAPRPPYGLVALLLILVAAIAAVAYRYHLSQKRAIEREVRNELLAVADMKVRQISDWREERLNDASTIMANRMALKTLRRLLTGQGAASDRAEAQQWMEALCSGLPYADAVLTDAGGNPVLQVGRLFGDAAHIKALADEVLSRNEPFLRDFHRDMPGHAIHLGLNVPLRLDASSPPFGALLLGINPNDYLYPLLRRWPIPSSTAETVLVRKDGNDILYLNNLRSKPNSAMNLRMPLSRTDVPAVKAAEGVEGSTRGPDYRGVPVYAAMRGVPGTSWFLVAKMDSQEVQAPIARRSLPVGLGAFGLILAAVSCVAFVWRRQQVQFYRAQFQAEVQRRALVGHYDYLSRFANDIILLMDDDGRIIEANDRAVDAYGYTREALLGMNIRQLRHRSELLALDRQWALAGSRNSLLYETVHQRRDGSAMPVEVSTRVIAIEGRVFRQSIIRDITERRAMDEKLRLSLQNLEESESRFRATFEQAAVGMVHLSLDGRFIRVNQRFCEISGYSLEELLRLTTQDLSRREELAREEPLSRKLIAGEIDSLVLERRLIRKDRSEVWINVTRSVLRSPAGEPIHFVSVVEDITERRRAREALLHSEQRFRQVVENAPDAIVVADAEMRLLYLNPVAARLLGARSTAELLGRSMLDMTHPDERDAARQRNSLAAGGVPAPTAERRLVRLDGETLPVEISGAPIVYDQQPAALAFFRDVSERKRTEAERALLEAQLRQAQKMESIGRLAGGVAHDFNNHLTVINGYCDMLKAQFPEVDPARESLDEIRAAGERAAALTQQLLAFSRKQIAEPRPILLNDVVADAGKMLRRLIGEDVEIVTNLDPELAVVMADPGQMNQVLMNLAVNARDAMPEGGTLSIETGVALVDPVLAALNPDARPGRFATLAVADTGMGIRPEMMQKIFEPFFTTKKGMGTGLGLATVYGIVRQNSGWIHVTSAPGEGTTFRVYLPRSAAPMKESANPSEKSEDGRGSETVLVVEDQPEVRRLAMAILEHKGYRLLEAANGAEALAIAAAHAGPIHLLLTDVIMPGMNGKELASRLSELRPSLKVLFTSGYTADAIGRQGVLDPGTSYLPKPFTSSQLTAKIREVLGSN